MNRTSATTRLIVAPHNFEIGGSQINALELAEVMARRSDYEVVLYAPDGELADRARATGLQLHLSGLRESAPSPARIVELTRLARRTRADLVHAYEWAPTIDAVYGPGWCSGVPVVSTILSMDYPHFVPAYLPIIVGTRELYDAAIREGRPAQLLEPVVDTDRFRPGAVSADTIARTRAECGVGPDEQLIVVVSRLAARLKLDGLLTLVRAAGVVARETPIRLVIVGDGLERERVAREGRLVNTAARSQVVRLVGQRHDPLPYYAAADLVVGMGGSALRAMAVGRPLLVQGERGFWAVADEQTFPLFAARGWYGVGDGHGSVQACVAGLRRLTSASPDERESLERFGRRVVLDHYSLEGAAAKLHGIYQGALCAAAESGAVRAGRAAALSKEIVKYRLALRAPWLQTASHRVRGR